MRAEERAGGTDGHWCEELIKLKRREADKGRDFKKVLFDFVFSGLNRFAPLLLTGEMFERSMSREVGLGVMLDLSISLSSHSLSLLSLSSSSFSLE